MRFTIAAIWLLAAWAQTSPPVERIRARMQENLANVPKYTCTETIARTYAAGPENETRDRIRVEVVLAGGHELVSWPRASRFEDKVISDLIPDGTTIEGHFAGFASSVFLKAPGTYTYRGVNRLGRRNLLRYDYEIPDLDGQFRIRIGELQSAVGFRGSFFVDPQSLDVVRLEVEAMRVPGWLGVRDMLTAIEYGRMRIGSASFLLPHRTETRVRYQNGSEDRNQTEYTDCRQYTAESTVRFGDPGELSEPSGASSPGGSPTLPAGIAIPTRLRAGFDLPNCAMGDPVRIQVTQRVRRGGVDLPRGTLIQGRITCRRTMIDRDFGRRGLHATLLGIRFSAIEAGGGMPFRAKLANCSAFPYCVEKDREVQITFQGRLRPLARDLLLDWVTE